MVAELKNPASFNRLTGVPSLSADSAGYNTENGQYWRGAVWPPTQCMVQEGLKQTGYLDDLQELAEKYHRVRGRLPKPQDAPREHWPRTRSSAAASLISSAGPVSVQWPT